MYPAFSPRAGCLVGSFVPGGQSTGIIRLMREPGQSEFADCRAANGTCNACTQRRKVTLRTRLICLVTESPSRGMLPIASRRSTETCRSSR